MQCVAVRCSALQCVAVCGSVLQCDAVCCSVLQCVCARLCVLSVCMDTAGMCVLQCVAAVLQWCCSGVAAELQWCGSGVAVVLQWCCSGVALVLQWCCSGVALVLQWCCSGVAVVLQCAAMCMPRFVCIQRMYAYIQNARVAVWYSLSHRMCNADRNTVFYGVATISRLVQIIGLFCKRDP